MKLVSRALHTLKNHGASFSTTSTSRQLVVKPGQVLDSRFQIIKQLGSGQHSTVWLANSDNGPKALKILTNDVTALQGKESYELEVLKRIASVQSGLEQKRLLQLKYHFRIHGKHGDHLCLVTEPLGPSLLDVRSKFESKCFPLQLVKRVTRQLLEGLDILHNQCQAVHTDIKPDNILLSKASLSGNEDIVLGAINEADVVLVDFGTAIPPIAPHSCLIQPTALRSPEVLAGCVWDTKTDIWNLGCIVFELIAGTHLFRPRAIDNWSAEHYHLSRIFATAYTKPLPQDVIDFFRRGQHFDKYFKDESRALRLTADPEPMDTILHAYDMYTPELCSFLSAMLRILPSERSSAKDLLSFDWLR